MRPSTAVATLHNDDETAKPPEPTRRKVHDRMFTVTFIDAAEKLAKEVRTLTAMRLFHVLPKHLSHHEWRRLDQRTVAAELGTTQGVISTALAELLKLGVVEKRRAGPAIEWRLSPDYSWKGDVDSYDRATAEGRRKVFPPGAPSTLQGRIRNTPGPTTTGERQPEQGRNTSQRGLNLLRPIKGGAAE